MAFLDKTGLERLWAHIILKLGGKSDINHTHNVATTTADGFISASDKTKLDGIESGASVTTLRFPQEAVTEVNISSEAKSGDIVIGTAAKCNIQNISSGSYLNSNSNFVPTTQTLCNFLQVTHETVDGTIPAGEQSITVALTKKSLSNEIIIPASASAIYYASLRGNNTDNGYVDEITFYRTPGQSTAATMACRAFLTRLKVMKY